MEGGGEHLVRAGDSRQKEEIEVGFQGKRRQRSLFLEMRREMVYICISLDWKGTNVEM